MTADTLPVLQARGLRVAHGTGPEILSGLDFRPEPGRITALVGPNGSGKSTLLATLARVLVPRGGAVLLDGAAIHGQPPRHVARQLGLLPQQPAAPEGVTVRALLERGRFPHRGPFGGWTAADEAAVARALDLTDLADMAVTPLDRLSGGQRQRAWIAMAVAQATPILLLDEPTTFLDIAHQFDVMALIERLRDEAGVTVVAALHDLAQAARHADRMAVMDAGAIVAEGVPADILTPDLLARTFGITARIWRDEATGALICLPLGRRPLENTRDTR